VCPFIAKSLAPGFFIRCRLLPRRQVEEFDGVRTTASDDREVRSRGGTQKTLASALPLRSQVQHGCDVHLPEYTEIEISLSHPVALAEPSAAALPSR
jgi:hypothetical protein